MGVKTGETIVRHVKPLLSVNRDEARKRVLNLYRAWYRQVPYIVKMYDIPRNQQQCREKLREYFLMHKNETNIRIIDMLIIKGQMELQEAVELWKQRCHIMGYFDATVQKKPKDFLTNFLQ